MKFNQLNYLGTRWKIGQKVGWYQSLEVAWSGTILVVFKEHFEIKWDDDSFISKCGIYHVDLFIDDQSS